MNGFFIIRMRRCCCCKWKSAFSISEGVAVRQYVGVGAGPLHGGNAFARGHGRKRLLGCGGLLRPLIRYLLTNAYFFINILCMKPIKPKQHINIGTVASMAALIACASTAHADLIHRYSFNGGTANDSVGSANGTLVGSTDGGPTISGGQLQLNNPNFSGPSVSGNYLSLPSSILPSSGSATIEEWFTFTGSGFFTEAYTFSNSQHDANPPGSNNGQYLMGVISAPQGGPVSAGGGSHIAQSLAGYAGGETDAYGTTPGIGAGGGGYLDDGETFMMATVIDATAGTLSYYLYDKSQGGVGGTPRDDRRHSSKQL